MLEATKVRSGVHRPDSGERICWARISLVERIQFSGKTEACRQGKRKKYDVKQEEEVEVLKRTTRKVRANDRMVKKP